MAAAVLVVALTLQQPAFLESIELTGQRRGGQAHTPAQGAGGHLAFTGQHLQDHQLHRAQAAVTRQTLGMHFGILLQPAHGLEQRQFEGLNLQRIDFI